MSGFSLLLLVFMYVSTVQDAVWVICLTGHIYTTGCGVRWVCIMIQCTSFGSIPVPVLGLMVSIVRGVLVFWCNISRSLCFDWQFNYYVFSRNC